MLTLINQVMASVGTLLIFLQMLLICSDIAARFLFDRPISGVLEIVELTIVAIVFLMLPNSIATGALVRSDALFSALQRSRPAIARMMDLFFSLIGVLVLAAIAYGVWGKLTLAILRGHFTGNPGIFTAPIWPALLCIVIGSAWGAVNFGDKAVTLLFGQRGPNTGDPNVGH
ncbi:TRAP transporter small permease subunit [Marinovum sp.]|uniref:TRAP transporter small permease subunit n=1 Tax=Marinovum sp. TaxID=2024839 RepID=UPI002B27BC64|nr:TRAP transporter small permease subunit [Marinovum sp.]